jgi:hypothetical protein
MSKIVQAVNAMIANPENISNVIWSRDGEIFFLYKKKYKWSMAKRDRDNDYLLWFYPEDIPLEQLASYEGHDWEGTPMVTYKASEIGTKEAKATFAELYTLLKERVHGVQEVLDDIIKDDPNRF